MSDLFTVDTVGFRFRTTAGGTLALEFSGPLLRFQRIYLGKPERLTAPYLIKRALWFIARNRSESDPAPCELLLALLPDAMRGDTERAMQKIAAQRLMGG